MLGQVVYHSNTSAPSKIYIIANGHRSAITGANAVKTVQAQVETFRIGEWLIQQNQIELLLPEGFFGQINETDTGTENNRLLDNKALRETLTDTSLFVNAELLLHKNYGISLNQIEDRTLYSRTRERLRASLNTGDRHSAAFNSEFAYLQKLRTAAILQGTPGAIENAYHQGRISAPHAMLTIGLGHLDDILTFLEAGEINIAALQTNTRDFPALAAKLELLKNKISVTVIVPRALIDHRQNLKRRT